MQNNEPLLFNRLHLLYNFKMFCLVSAFLNNQMRIGLPFSSCPNNLTAHLLVSWIRET
jgi:hypothetical protein